MLKQKQREKEFRERFRAKVAFSCDIGNFDALQANGCIFPHPVGIVISRYVKVGRGCVFYQNVTVGVRRYPCDGKTEPEEYPQIGNNVIVYSGAVIVGPVKIGDNAVIGANAVVTRMFLPERLLLEFRQKSLDNLKSAVRIIFKFNLWG